MRPLGFPFTQHVHRDDYHPEFALAAFEAAHAVTKMAPPRKEGFNIVVDLHTYVPHDPFPELRDLVTRVTGKQVTYHHECWFGQSIHTIEVPMDFEILLHEFCHWIVATPAEREVGDLMLDPHTDFNFCVRKEREATWCERNILDEAGLDWTDIQMASSPYLKCVPTFLDRIDCHDAPPSSHEYWMLAPDIVSAVSRDLSELLDRRLDAWGRLV